MPIIDPQEWVRELFNKKFNPIDNHSHRNLPGTAFPPLLSKDWLSLLYKQGMLPAGERFKQEWQEWEEQVPMKLLQEKYKEYKSLFSGPELDVYLFPVNTLDRKFMNTMKGRNGLTFNSFIFLFFQKDIAPAELSALLLHEYHHACRLDHHHLNEQNISLLESMVMEGLAETEVKRIIGEEYVAPWMTMYDQEFLGRWWERKIKNKIDIIGRKRQLPYLYGGKYGFPKWLGYAMGYKITESYIANCGIQDHISFVKMTADEIYRGSDFVQ
ncbi:DUF2268 domain-containing protein [Evansella sp. LMS18]|jgi:uncharacterized protein YjaZ|uniref:DUF2268 domain-containing protein n=1 Tax=Evansella sp. LMS18 TaxID=2924033 RepID=UPI0020D1C124|nr:DUF2268 domain-containing putative Zn-dependent protease [Evansella sp. LMS18]UTR11129.1 DUF2268 domain-containing protein [Evansella sp. LMS18]